MVGLRLAGEQPGAFEHEVSPDLPPGKFRRVTLGEHPDAVAVDDHGIAVHVHLAVELAVRGVVASQVCVRLRIAQIVDRHDLDLCGALALVQSAQHVATDAPVAIDADLDCHTAYPFNSSLICLPTLSAVNPK
jgi:hypothetical protein